MTKDELLQIVDNNLKPQGLPKKTNSWYQESDELIKLINLQKSNFGNYYNLNYGLIVKGLEIHGLAMHVFNRLGSTNKEENKKIEDTINLENDIKNDVRKKYLGELLNNILSTLYKINTTEDLLQYHKKRPHLNDVPLIVKKHFNLV